MARLGRRGLSLTFFGVLDLIYAFSLTYPDQESRDGAFLTWVASTAPLSVWAAFWAGVGVLCLIYSVRRSDRVGFAAAIFLKVTWASVCLGGWLLGDADRGYVSAAIWLAAAGFVWVISGWPEAGDWKGPTWKRQRSSQPAR